LFKSQIISENAITVTDPSMTRYLMSKSEAIKLVFEAVKRSIGGEIFVMRMPATSVENIAKSMISIFGNSETKINIIGSRPGEKLDEVLVSRNESPYTKIIDDTYYVVLPQTKDKTIEESYSDFELIETEEFNSRNAIQICENELTKILQGEKWLV